MDIEGFLAQYGYFALFLGTFLEGESFLLLAGFLASRGYLSLTGVILVSFSGAFLGNIFYYALGRWRGKSLILRATALDKSYQKVQLFVERYGGLSVFVSQFFYGTRLISSLAFGAMLMSFKRFAGLQFMATLTWAAVAGSVGYLFGETLEKILGDIRHYEKSIAVAVFGLAMAYVLFRLIHHRFKKNRYLNKAKQTINQEHP